MFLLVVSKFKMIGIAIERCARSSPKKLTKTYHKGPEPNGFHNHSTVISMCRLLVESFTSVVFHSAKTKQPLSTGVINKSGTL